MTITKRFAFLLPCLLVGGCAGMSPMVNLNPTAPASLPTFKKHPPVYLTVMDDRPAEALGQLPSRPNEKPIPVKSVAPVEDVVRLHVVTALTRAGFHILSVPDATSPQLVVQVKRLDFKLEKGGTWSEISGKGSLAVTAKVGTATREKTYNAENGKKSAFSPPPDGHEQYLNQLLTDMLNGFLTDDKFLTFLAGGA